ncbi:MAG: HU family DNA-binding protein [Planctomycetota bacterium]
MPATAPNVTKKHIIDGVAARTGLRRSDVQAVVQGVLDQIVEEVRLGRRIELRDFGVFEVKQRAARTAQNPKTLERVPVPPKRAVRFKVGRLMREALEADACPAAERHDGVHSNGHARADDAMPHVHVEPRPQPVAAGHA